MNWLPKPLLDVEISAFFAPSHIHSIETCRLRALIGTSTLALSQLPEHPSSEMGRVFHGLVEQAIKGAITRVGAPHEDVARALEVMLESAQDFRLMESPGLLYIELERTVSPLLWQRRRQAAIDVATRLLAIAREKPAQVNAQESRTFSYLDLPHEGRWAEIPITAPRLRLKGRMDVVEKRDSVVTIRDLKSGVTLDGADQVIPRIDLQMRLYGAMILDIAPKSRVRLVVDNGQEHEVPFGPTEALETTEWIAANVIALPVGTRIATNELAAPGVSCVFCPIRPICESYLNEAPKRWVNGSQERFPIDTWGVVELLVRREGGTNDLTIRDAARRKVKVFGVRDCHLDGVAVGTRIWLFGLIGKAMRNADGHWRHPLNFHECSDDRTQPQAWSLKVFRSN